VNKNGENKEERNFETSVARKKTAAVNSPITCEYFVATEHRGKISQPSHAIIGNESVPIQLAQCRFPGLAIFNAKIKYTEAIFRTALGNCYGLKLPKMLIAV